MVQWAHVYPIHYALMEVDGIEGLEELNVIEVYATITTITTICYYSQLFLLTITKFTIRSL